MGYDAYKSLPTFRRNVLHPLSGPKHNLNVLHPVVFYIVSRGTDTQRLRYSQYCSITVSNFITFTTCFGSQNHHQVTPLQSFHVLNCNP
jgi:hypothetical protein